MLNEQTIAKMNEMKLFGMARGFVQRNGKPDHGELSHAEFVGLLVDDEKTHRETRRLERLLKNAKFKQQACLEDIDYKNPRGGLSKQVMLELAGGHWLVKNPQGLGCLLPALHPRIFWPRLASVAAADGSRAA